MGLDEAAAELRRLHSVNAELQELIDGIYIYANDTLSGRVDGPDDRDWQRASVVEIRNRARAFSTVASARAAIAKAKEAAARAAREADEAAQDAIDAIKEVKP
jgi:hypothetical protein